MVSLWHAPCLHSSKNLSRGKMNTLPTCRMNRAETKHTTLDILTSGWKSTEKDRRNEKASESGEAAGMPFRICLKRSLEEERSPEERETEAPRVDRRNSREQEEEEAREKPANDAILLGMGPGEPGGIRIQKGLNLPEVGQAGGTFSGTAAVSFGEGLSEAGGSEGDWNAENPTKTDTLLPAVRGRETALPWSISDDGITVSDQSSPQSLSLLGEKNSGHPDEAGEGRMSVPLSGKGLSGFSPPEEGAVQSSNPAHADKGMNSPEGSALPERGNEPLFAEIVNKKGEKYTLPGSLEKPPERQTSLIQAGQEGDIAADYSEPRSRSGMGEDSATVREGAFKQETNFLASPNAKAMDSGGSFFPGTGIVSMNSKAGESHITQPQVMMEQIVEAGIPLIQKRGGRVKMTLNPPNLGSLDLDISVRNNKVEVVLVAGTPEIQHSLQANGELLKTALSQQGLKVEAYQVLLQENRDPNFGSSAGDSGWWRNSGRENRGEEERANERTPSDRVAEATRREAHSRAAYGGISLFI